jgi:hypothetical protein
MEFHGAYIVFWHPNLEHCLGTSCGDWLFLLLRSDIMNYEIFEFLAVREYFYIIKKVLLLQ